jgi:hypothetical protein
VEFGYSIRIEIEATESVPVHAVAHFGRIAMCRSLLVCLFATVLSVGVLAAPVPKAKPKEFGFPTEIGTKWVYAAGKAGEREWTEEIMESEKRDDTVWIKVQYREAENSHYVTYSVSPQCVTQLNSAGWKIDNVLLQLPPKKGDTWKVGTPIQKGLICDSGQMTVGEVEEVTVPAGKYKTIKVEYEVTNRSGVELEKPITYKYWYASEVGLVKFTTTDFERSLKSFTPGKK